MRLFDDASAVIGDPLLRRAYALAEKGRGSTSPNPVVGCVIARGGAVVGEGFHERAGGPHAEVVALAAAGGRAHDATAYVTLEPCHHTGRTGPCTAALVEAGVRRVVIGTVDPNTAVSGGGADALRASGLEVLFAPDPAPFEAQNEAWVTWVRTGLPWVRVKVAVTLDGRTALRSGVRTRISGAGGADVTRRLRAAADAVLVGAGTVAADDPALTVRGADGTRAVGQPRRVVLGRTNVPPASCRVFRDGVAPTTVLLEEGAKAPALPEGIEFATYPARSGVRGALRVLGTMELTSLLVEPGPRLFAALWDADAIDELVLVQSGSVLGEQAAPLSAGPSPESGAGARLRPVETGIAGDDAVSVWRRSEDDGLPV